MLRNADAPLTRSAAIATIAGTAAALAMGVSARAAAGRALALTGGGAVQGTNYRLDISLSSASIQVIVDINTARPDIQNYGIDASYTLTDLNTKAVVVTGTTFSRVSYNLPGQQQRFAGDRGLRDAENSAAQVIAENIRTRLASFFVAGT